MTPYEHVAAERARQDAKWGVQRHDPARWHLILSEEVGEVAEAILKGGPVEAFEELVQVAAVAVAWLEHMIEESGAAGAGGGEPEAVHHSAETAPCPSAPIPGDFRETVTEDRGAATLTPASEPPSRSPEEWAQYVEQEWIARVWTAPENTKINDLKRALLVESFAAAMFQARREGAAAMLERCVEWVDLHSLGVTIGPGLRNAMEETKHG